MEPRQTAGGLLSVVAAERSSEADDADDCVVDAEASARGAPAVAEADAHITGMVRVIAQTRRFDQ